ncbi:MAG: undecaprenyldiphospho-muramoylpentapeptide beta-N-acetylglucosaminyltransferase [Gammaproteobacteria bacterium]
MDGHRKRYRSKSYVSGIRGKGLTSLLLAPFKLLRALVQTHHIFKKRKPDLVMGFGGFVSGPAGIMAFLTRTPYVIHEQNAIAGLTNRYLSYGAKRVFSSFGSAFSSHKNITVTGNPVRAEILALPQAKERFAKHTGPLRILILGGSLGALRINEVVPHALAKLTMPIVVKHQCGEGSYDKTCEAYQMLKIDCEVMKFIDDMANVYSWADIVICRAGATTIAELIAVGLGSILIPYPYAVDDHQTQNGLYLQNANAAILIAQKDLTQELLAQTLEKIGTRDACAQMAIAANSIYQGDAVGKIINSCEEVLNG